MLNLAYPPAFIFWCPLLIRRNVLLSTRWIELHGRFVDPLIHETVVSGVGNFLCKRISHVIPSWRVFGIGVWKTKTFFYWRWDHMNVTPPYFLTTSPRYLCRGFYCFFRGDKYFLKRLACGENLRRLSYPKLYGLDLGFSLFWERGRDKNASCK